MARNHLVCRYSFHVIRLSVDRLCKIYGSKLKCPHVCERVGWWDGLDEVKGEERQLLSISENTVHQAWGFNLTIPRFVSFPPPLSPSLSPLVPLIPVNLIFSFRSFCYRKLK